MYLGASTSGSSDAGFPPALQENFIYLSHDGRTILRRCPESYEGAQWLAARIFPSLVHSVFVFEVQGLGPYKEMWVEVDSEVWDAVHPYLSLVRVKITGEQRLPRKPEGEEQGAHRLFCAN